MSLLAWVLDLEYMPWWKAGLIFLALATPVTLLALRSLAGLGPVRRWVALGARLLLLAVLVLLLGGARWQREHKSLDLIVLRDISLSTENFPVPRLQEAIDSFLRKAAAENRKGNRDDRIGIVSFNERSTIDAMPFTSLVLDARSIRDRGAGTDVSEAIRLGMATFRGDAMRRMLLIWDGNSTGGDLEAQLAAAAAQNVPIDVLKLSYEVKNEVIVERLVAPTWRKEGEAFELSVVLLSTNLSPVTGRLEVFEDGRPIGEPRPVTLPPGSVNSGGRIEPRKHVERVRVAASKASGVRSFEARFVPDVVSDRNDLAGPGKPGDTLLSNNSYSAFTFVQGQGRVLYVDNSREGGGATLMKALQDQRINVERITMDDPFPDFVQLQGFDAVILNNVPRSRTLEGPGGVAARGDQDPDADLARYVHDFGGGLIMIGGPQSFGAGGWQGSKVAEVLPVEMDIPAQRQMPKGALVLIIHSCEMADGNYWGEQCALKAIETLSAQDDVGVIVYDGMGAAKGGVGGASWVYPLAPKGDGTKVSEAVRKMQVGDMPSFDDSVTLAVRGAGPGQPSLLTSNAAQKHIIVISDGDPSAPNGRLIDDMVKNKISCSTISVYPHQGFIPPTMERMARATGGRYYGPIEQNPGKLPQIFIKEATVVRRTLIQESLNPPIGVLRILSASEVMKGCFPDAPGKPIPPIHGMVLTSPKNNPTIEMPLKTTLERKTDPLLAHWQAGLGKSAAFTSDASATWMSPWFEDAQASAAYGKMFSQMVRWVSRPPMSRDLSVTTARIGDKAVITVEATDAEGGYSGALSISGQVRDPDGQLREVRLVRTGPGTYSAEFPVGAPGNYVVAMSYAGKDGRNGFLVSGLAVSDSPETRQLRSNDQMLQLVADRTGGRVYNSFDPEIVDLFSRENIRRSGSPMPVWDILLPILLGLVILDVAIRRIAWDYNAMKRSLALARQWVQSFTTTRKVEAEATLGALKRVRDEVAEAKFKTDQPTAGAPPPLPSRSAKFEAKGPVEGDITSVVGGATNKPVPPPPKEAKPKGAVPGAPGGHTGSLLEAKRRAQQKIKEKEQGE